MEKALQHMQAHFQKDIKVQLHDDAEYQSGSGMVSQLQPQVIYGYISLKNRRGHPKEDFIVAEVREVDGNEIAVFGVFDSHRGQEIGQELQKHLFENILCEGGVKADPAGATRDGYLLTDRQILENAELGQRSGSTAVTAMLVEHGSRLIVANLGDSRAVLSRNGQAVQLSVDHSPARPSERACVEMRGGHVTTVHGDVARVDGQLAVARAFGDKFLKEHMSAKPDLSDVVVDLSCEFLILGTNGFWSVFANQEAVDCIRYIEDPQHAALHLVQQARERFSDDDISCIVIRFVEQ